MAPTHDRRGAPTAPDISPARAETYDRLCPMCSSDAICMARGRVLADCTGILRIEYQCQACSTPFCLLQRLAAMPWAR